LAIVAYRQSITRADVEAIRGVQSADMLHQLMEKGLVRISGRDESLGRPVLYATTRKFLQFFGLRTLRDLPQAQELIDPARKRKKATPEEES
jgi:segregation and condensation protein B